MHVPPFPQPSPELLSAFVNGDPISIDKVVQIVLPPLLRWAWKQYSGLPQDEVESLMYQVLGEVCVNHSRYNPTRAKFTTYVINLYTWRIRDLLEKDSKEGETSEVSSEEQYENLIQLPYNSIEDEEKTFLRQQFYKTIEDNLDPVEREFLQFMRLGIKDSEVYGEIVKRFNPLAEDIPKEIKNAKERLQRRIRALAIELGYFPEDLL